MPHYFSEVQTSSRRETELKVTLLGNRLTFSTASGMFSLRRIDPGSRLLIEAAELPPSGTLLDFGCGYGAVGIALAKAHPNLSFALVDVNRKALACAARNARRNNVPNAEVRFGNFYEGLGRFDAILSNPPIAAGRKACFRIIDEATGHMTPGGSLQLVARHRNGGEALRERMRATFGNVADVAKRAGYRVYRSTA